MSNTALDLFFTQMARFQVLDDEQTISLAHKVQTWQQHEKGPDAAPVQVRLHGIAARDKLVRHNLRLVVHIWKDNYSTRLKTNNPGLPDAFQNAAAAMLRAAEKYDPKTGHRFSTYAGTWIHKGFKTYLCQEERTVRIPSNVFHQAKVAIAIECDRMFEGLPKLSAEELHAELSKTRKHMPTPENLQSVMTSYLQTMPRSFSEPLSKGMVLGDLVNNSASDQAHEESLADQAMNAMERLTQFERDVLSARFLKTRGEVGRKTVARRFKVSVETIETTEAIAIKRIRKIMCSSR